MKLFKIMACAAGFAAATMAAAPVAAQDPGPGIYSQALAGKRIVMIPMAMGFDLAQGWDAILKREIKDFGGIYEVRDPNWSTEAGAQALTEAIASDPKPDLLVVMAFDLNSYSKLLKRAQRDGIYVILIDNPANFKADAYIGPDWTDIGRKMTEAAIAGCGENSSKQIGVVQGDEVNATSLFMAAGITEAMAAHPDFEIVAKPVSNWDATTARDVTATMLQQHPDVCAVIDFWDGNASGTAAAIREAGKTGEVKLVTTGGGEETSACKGIEEGTYDALVSTELEHESDAMVAMIKYLLQAQPGAGTYSPYLYDNLSVITKDNLNPHSCWNLAALQARAAE